MESILRLTEDLHADISSVEDDFDRFIARGAGINNSDSEGKTALHAASKRGNVEILEKLLENGAGIDDVNNDGCTPLMFACRHGNLKVASILVCHGAEME